MKSEKLNCLLIHVPKFKHIFYPFNTTMFINLMPVGLLSIADVLSRKGYKVEIIHLGIEKLYNPDFSLEKYLKCKNPDVAGITLHWHHQSYDAIQIAKKVKETLPYSFLVLGGFTASFFAEEIMESFDFVDGIIKGEGEISMTELLSEIGNRRNLSRVPNLIWRDGGKIINNEHTFVSNNEKLSSFSFENYSLLKNFKHYFKMFYYMFPEHKGVNALMEKIGVKASVFIPIGRGCLGNCTYCGGSYSFHSKYLFRRNLSIRNVETVVGGIEKLIRDYGAEKFNIDFCPFDAENYFFELFKKVRQHKVEITLNLSSYFLPSKDLIREFKTTFKEGSEIIISPDTGSESLRKIHKTCFYSNEDLIKTLEFMDKQKVPSSLYFISGLPLETEKDKDETKRLYRYFLRFKMVKRIITFPLEIDPGSTLFHEPEKFSILLKVKNFRDYYSLHSRRIFSPGYRIKNLSEEDMFKMKCRDFCYFHPTKGKYICKSSRLFFRYRIFDRLLLKLTSIFSPIVKRVLGV